MEDARRTVLTPLAASYVVVFQDMSWMAMDSLAMVSTNGIIFCYL